MFKKKEEKVKKTKYSFPDLKLTNAVLLVVQDTNTGQTHEQAHARSCTRSTAPPPLPPPPSPALPTSNFLE